MSDLPEPIQRLGLLILTLTLTFLRPLALLISTCSTPISPTFYPFPLATTLHALRISHAYKGRVKALGHEGAMKVRGRAVELAGYLAMAWGGSFINALLLGNPPPQLLHPYPLLNYVSVYLFVNSPYLIPYHPSAETLDVVLPVIDGLTRSFPIAGAINQTSRHSHPLIKSSLMYQIICGGLAASGGGIVASTLNVFSPEWRIATPPILHGGLFGSLDFLAGAAGSMLYGLLTFSHPTYIALVGQIQNLPATIFSLLNNAPSEKPIPAAPTPLEAPMTNLGAQSAVVLFLAIVYATKAYVIHGSPTVAKVQAARAAQKSKVDEKVRGEKTGKKDL